MANNVQVQYDEATGMLHFIVDPTLIVGGPTKQGSEYVCQSERFGEDVPGAPGWKFNLAVWIRPNVQKEEKVKAAPVVRSNMAVPFQRPASVPGQVRKDIAPGKSQTVAINRMKG